VRTNQPTVIDFFGANSKYYFNTIGPANIIFAEFTPGLGDVYAGCTGPPSKTGTMDYRNLGYIAVDYWNEWLLLPVIRTRSVEGT
jgi:hypothetical protein